MRRSREGITPVPFIGEIFALEYNLESSPIGQSVGVLSVNLTCEDHCILLYTQTVRHSNSIFTVAALRCELGKMKKTRNRKQNLSPCKHFPALSMGTSCNLSNFSLLGATNHRAQISMTYENLTLTSC